MTLKHLVRFAGGIAWQLISRVILFIFLGVVLNWILFFLLPDMCSLSDKGMGWLTYFKEIASQCTISFIIGFLFLIAFPFAFVFLGYKYSIQNAIHYSYVKNKSTFYQYLSNRMLSFVETKQSGDSNALQLAGNFLEKLDNVPWVMRTVIAYFKDKIPFADVLEKMSAKMDLTPENSEAVALQLAEDADTYIEDELLKPDLTLVWVLMGLSIGLFAVAHLLLA